MRRPDFTAALQARVQQLVDDGVDIELISLPGARFWMRVSDFETRETRTANQMLDWLGGFEMGRRVFQKRGAK